MTVMKFLKFYFLNRSLTIKYPSDPLFRGDP